jgi:hypothetical protein
MTGRPEIRKSLLRADPASLDASAGDPIGLVSGRGML